MSEYFERIEEEIARLTRERDEALAEVEFQSRLITELVFEVERQEAEHERLKTMPQAAWVRLLADAKRYRWLRDKASTEDLFGIEFWLYDTGEEIDAVIDGAMEGE